MSQVTEFKLPEIGEGVVEGEIVPRLLATFTLSNVVLSL